MSHSHLQSIDTLDTPLDVTALMKAYSYQSYLTSKLDALAGDFDQATINEIALWKVNRYPHTSTSEESSVLPLINRISQNAQDRDETLTTEVLHALLLCKGVRLPMASTILRFRNPHIYQIIDQRVFRFIYGEEYKEPSQPEAQISCYLHYLKQLENVCQQHNIPFHLADRVLYQADIQHNKHQQLNY